MKITLCVSVPDEGLDMLRMLVESAAILASGEHDIRIDFTVNSEAERARVLAAALPLPLGRHHLVPRETGTRLALRSINHSRCISALYAGAEGDVAVICDYDVAFARKDWDKILVEKIVTQGVRFFGTPYSEIDALPVLNFGNMQVQMRKYQKKPNAIFLAYAPGFMKSVTDHICTFARRYGGTGDVPAKFIANEYHMACYGIPIAQFVNFDTGYRVAELIEEHQLKWESLTRRVSNYKVMCFPEHSPLEHYSPRHWPEEYDLEGTPFIVHFRKGSIKSGEILTTYSKERFFEDVKAYIAKAA